MHVLINGGNINVVEAGDPAGTPVVFVHGFPFSHEMWTPQMAAIGTGYRAISYDVRGHGKSDVGDGQYSIESHVDDLFGLLELLKFEKAVVVGLSMGGYIVLRALERDQGKFIAAVLCDTRAEADSDEAKIRRFTSMTSVKKNGSAAFADGFVKAVFAPPTFDRDPAAVEAIRKIISRTPPLAIAGTLLALAARTDTTRSLGSIKVPVLILVGEKDVITPPEASRLMHEKIPGSELHIVPAAAHMSNLENPAVFNEHLTAFLRRVAPSR